MLRRPAQLDWYRQLSKSGARQINCTPQSVKRCARREALVAERVERACEVTHQADERAHPAPVLHEVRLAGFEQDERARVLRGERVKEGERVGAEERLALQRALRAEQ